ncbi:MAG: class I SAM-dependent rRNA methyltransferase [Pedosphaera sp.]|nr:class I SAM-dependent rRNA methyltransferase [Pedosphaera sp.]
MEKPLVTVVLRPGEADRVVAGHPWIYAASILRATQPPEDGSLVQVKDHRQRLLGVGFFNSKSKIQVRLIHTERVEVNQAFFEERIRAALALRKRFMPEATSFRVINSESDLLTGLIVDKYEDVIVLQTSSLGMDLRKHHIVGALQKIFNPRSILERNETASRKFEGLEAVSGVLAGEPVESIDVRINGLKFTVDLRDGHKTGMYLDQQVNHHLVAGLAKDATVLDCFTFLGGFAIPAAKAGARQVLGIDQNESAINAARTHAVLNGVSDIATFEVGNVFDWLKGHTTTGPNDRLLARFDLIILDPPSFTRNRASVGDALRGYKEIHVRALKLLKPCGKLVTFCCSHHVDTKLFEDVALSAAFDQRRLLRRIATYSQSPDHPILPSIPETEYLKGAAYELVR